MPQSNPQIQAVQNSLWHARESVQLLRNNLGVLINKDQLTDLHRLFDIIESGFDIARDLEPPEK